MNGLDLFSGIGGLTRALGRWVSPVAYCELDAYCRGVLLSRMWDRQIPTAPIWDDVRTLRGGSLSRRIDIIYGGFPCQDISVAGRGEGLGGERSGLFFEIERLVGETQPSFVFLENVPAIRTRGADVVTAKLARLGYDCRWDVVSAAEVGAPHLRKRWFLLAHANGAKRGVQPESRREDSAIVGNDGPTEPVSYSQSLGRIKRWSKPIVSWQARRASSNGVGLADTMQQGLQDRGHPELSQSEECERKAYAAVERQGSSWWAVEPNVGRVAHGVPKRVDRLRGLGNAVVPLQAQTAFKRLSGLE